MSEHHQGLQEPEEQLWVLQDQVGVAWTLAPRCHPSRTFQDFFSAKAFTPNFKSGATGQPTPWS
jgi:hypothetical protein